MSLSKMEETHDSCYLHNVTLLIGSVRNSVRSYCIDAYRCSQSYITSNDLTPPGKALRGSENTDQLEKFPSIQPRIMTSYQPTPMSSTRDAQHNPIESTAGVIGGHQDSPVVENVSEEEKYDVETDDSDFSDDSDEEEEEELEAAFGHKVDLVAQEDQVKRKPIYTRGLLNDVKLCANQVSKEFSLPPNRRELHHLDGCRLNQKSYRIWQSDNNRNANHLQVEYLSRVEMHPDFQHQYGKYSDQIKALRRYNKDHRNDCIDTPYTFITFRRQYFNEHRNNAKMQEYWAALMTTEGFWTESSTRRRLCEDFQETAKNCAPITQTVCFGLGALNLEKSFYHSAIQYMAVFSIIKTLNDFYRQTEPNRPAIKLVLQDPNYETKDHRILRELSRDSDNVHFVSDPEGLLAIDASTLVVTAFLPVQMPLVQIIADLFSKDPSKGPAAMICNAMTVDTEKREYSLSDRASPATARFLTNHYEKKEDGFDDHGREDELMADVYGDDWKEKKRFYWLNYMDFWVRKVDAE